MSKPIHLNRFAVPAKSLKKPSGTLRARVNIEKALNARLPTLAQRADSEYGKNRQAHSRLQSLLDNGRVESRAAPSVFWESSCSRVTHVLKPLDGD